ncbi:MAG: hypothetical protein CMJ18_01535 [Phycisphaeraceae bacterium]|nr:hypothetical protein [Phycisphaeraceae bacterium]
MRSFAQRTGLVGLVLLLAATSAWANGVTPQLLVAHRDGGETSDPGGIFSYGLDGTVNGRWDDLASWPTGRPPTGLAYDGEYVYAHVGDHTGAVKRFNPDGTFVDDIVPSGGSFGNLYVDATHIYVSQQDPVRPVLRFDKTNGAAAPSAGQSGANFTAPSESPNNARTVLLGGAGLANILVGEVGTGFLQYDGTTGARVGGGTGVFINKPRAFFAASGDPNGTGTDSLFLLDDPFAGGSNRVIEYNLATGAVIGDYGLGGGLPMSSGIAFDNAGALYALVPGNNQVAKVGPGGGNFGFFVTAGAGESGILFIPEPGTLALLGMSGLAVFVRPRREA